MKKIIMLTITAAALSLSMGAVAGGDAAAGKAASASCTGCHGMNGRSTNPANPNLAGQKEAYLVKSIKDYRDGKRKDAMMGSMVSGLSDADIANLAAFYSSVK
ncbi:MAG: cytochrome c [Gammaproteobacteria bacterium]|nr:cytochrome c [Gammaproteobacteria bacterium]